MVANKDIFKYFEFNPVLKNLKGFEKNIMQQIIL